MTLAIECSKPEPMNARSAHHRTASLAASDRVRAAIHSARHTSALHRTARQNSCGPARRPWPSTIVATSSAAGPLIVPPACTTAASASEPTKLPTSEAASTAATCRRVVRPPPALQHHHGVAGEQLGTGEHDERERDAEHRGLHELGGAEPRRRAGGTEISSTTAMPTYAPASADDAR